jgi:hypothetical protein
MTNDPSSGFGGDIMPDITTPPDVNGPDTQIDEASRPDIPEDYGLGQSDYDFSSRTFPDDLGKQGYNNHYMVININVQTDSQMNRVTGPGLGTRTLANVLDQELSKTDALRYRIDSNFFDSARTSFGQEPNINFNPLDLLATNITRPRYTRRIKESIALYMPNAELTFNDTHDFENISLTKFGAAVASGAVATFTAGIGAIFGGSAGAAAGAAAAGAVTNSLTGVAQAAQIYGRPINPKVEVLYANTMQREHRFDFIFSPSSQRESISLRQIIRTLRYHAAPELRPGAASFFWIPPAEFDITFYHRGRENTAIPRINTCALTQIDVSYSPNGTWSTFQDGFPTQIRMQLAFRETEVTHKLRVLQGF